MGTTDKRKRRPNAAPYSLVTALRCGARDVDHESRTVNIGGAFYPSEVPLVEEAASRAGMSRSDFVREWTLRGAQAQKVIAPVKR